MNKLSKKKICCNITRAWFYQQKFSDLRNLHKKSENFKPTIFCQRGQKNYLADFLAWLAY
jgi:hypothetical protein